jgi:hypothetical protein
MDVDMARNVDVDVERHIIIPFPSSTINNFSWTIEHLAKFVDS